MVEALIFFGVELISPGLSRDLYRGFLLLTML